MVDLCKRSSKTLALSPWLFDPVQSSSRIWHVVPVPKAETALWLAAIELAAVGVAVAWVPMSLAATRLAAGTLVDLSATLPSVVSDVSAVRLLSTSGSVAAAACDHLLGLHAG